MIRRGMTIGLLVVLVMAVVAGSTSISGAQTPPPVVPDHVKAWSIVPPGQNGLITADELAEAEASGEGDFSVYGPDFADQVAMYRRLVEDDHVAASELGEYYHSMQFGLPQGESATPYEPVPGAMVYRDSFGIPHIYADDEASATAALGYVSAEDRMWQMDVFRHAARGTLAEFVGGGEDEEFLAMDIETRREGYTEAEVTAMLDQLDDKFGSLGAKIQDGLQNYSDGVNAYIQELKSSPPSEHPVEYAGTGNPVPLFPTDWTPEDTAFLVVLQLRVFGETAGGELDHAALYQHLRKRLGKGDGRRVFKDLMFQNDPHSYTSIPRESGTFGSQDVGPVNWKSVAVPDNAKAVARAANLGQQLRAGLLAEMGFKSPASNAIIVSAKESETGNPLEIGAPQVGYATPAFFLDVDVHYPGTDVRGPAVPGASALVPLGRGVDYAWSLTTGFSDAVDTRAERLCEPDGSEPTVDSNHYRFRGECVAMSSRTETFTVKPPPTDPAPPSQEERTFYRTRHGPVFKRAKVRGEPVAFVKERFFWMRELDSIPRFYQWNAQTDGLEDFAQAARRFTMSFNSFYADANDIGYFHVGYYPRRTPGQHPSLPTWGTGRWEWQGRLPFRRHPKVINPAQGWIVNWNNKPAIGWDNFDGHKFGRVHRVRLLADNMRRVTAGERKASLAEIVNVIRNAATRDVRAVYLLDDMLDLTRGSEGTHVARVRKILRGWWEDGSHRKNLDNGDEMDRGPALAIFDVWWKRMVHAIYDDELGKDAFEFMGGESAINDYDPAGGSSFFFDFSSHVANLFDPRTRRGLFVDYCDDHLTKRRQESCRTIARRSLKAAIRVLVRRQGSGPGAWTTPREDIVMSSQGASGNITIPWQNRGTHNHVVEILSDYAAEP